MRTSATIRVSGGTPTPATAGSGPSRASSSACLAAPGAPAAARLWAVATIAAGLIGCACAVYLSLRGTGRLSTVPWMPHGIGQWADDHGRFRNLPAYFLLACPFLLMARHRRSRFRTMLAIGGFGTVLELAEYFVPVRMVEWQDIAWTWAGAAAAWALVEIGLRLWPERVPKWLGLSSP